mmetsp:Transcript_66873/g.193210  ORF Transcript_66873/g.193210 Transcript_66873/m.193210 type:complete len:238 (+) Transcript_66873:2475-3188(+)
MVGCEKSHTSESGRSRTPHQLALILRALPPVADPRGVVGRRAEPRSASLPPGRRQQPHIGRAEVRLFPVAGLTGCGVDQALGGRAAGLRQARVCGRRGVGRGLDRYLVQDFQGLGRRAPVEGAGRLEEQRLVRSQSLPKLGHLRQDTGAPRQRKRRVACLPQESDVAATREGRRGCGREPALRQVALRLDGNAQRAAVASGEDRRGRPRGIGRRGVLGQRRQPRDGPPGLLPHLVAA